MNTRRNGTSHNELVVNRRRTLKTFLELVRIDSESRNERKVGNYLKNIFRKMGYRVREDSAGSAIGGNCGNIYVTVPGKIRSAPTIMLNAHTDTVVPGNHVKPKVKRGVVTSDGTTVLGADDKSGVSAIVEAIRTIREKKIPHGNIQILFTVAEEIGLLGAKNVNASWLKADFGFAVDGGQIPIIHAAGPSQDAIEAEIFGRSAHAGVNPEKGIHAIQIAARAIAKMKLGRVDKNTTANIGIIEGGAAANIIPERVKMVGEARGRTVRQLKRQVHHMQGVLARMSGRAKARLKLRVSKVYRTFSIGKNKPVVRVVQSALKRLGFRPKLEPTQGGSDAHIFNMEYGIPTVVTGVGTMNIHTKRESIPVENLAHAAQLLVGIVEESAMMTKNGARRK